MRRCSQAINVCLCFFLLAGCATMFSGSTDNVVINSEPSGARVTINGVYQGIAPVTVNLKRDKDYKIILQRDGFQETSAILHRKFNAIALLNLINPICWAVDAATAAIWKFERNEITVRMKQANLAPTQTK